MPHAPSGWCSETCDERHGRFLDFAVLHHLGCFLFRGSSDLANQNNPFCIRVLQKEFHTILVAGSIERISADTDNNGLTKTHLSSLVNSLVGQRSGTRDDSNLAFAMDISRHDTHFALTRLNDPWTVGSNHTSLGGHIQCVLHPHHVLLRDSFGDHNDQRNLCLDRIKRCPHSKRGRNVNNRSIWLNGFFGFSHSVEHWKPKMGGTSLLWSNPSHHLGSVSN
mmetsp:Transcript_38859/g.122464  ORF Transcript_38859/g.122464 Transcript_38859/m.122464 type:complete len:222 (-) Transcript_38859:216-881(-)